MKQNISVTLCNIMLLLVAFFAFFLSGLNGYCENLSNLSHSKQNTLAPNSLFLRKIPQQKPTIDTIVNGYVSQFYLMAKETLKGEANNLEKVSDNALTKLNTLDVTKGNVFFHTIEALIKILKEFQPAGYLYNNIKSAKENYDKALENQKDPFTALREAQEKVEEKLSTAEENLNKLPLKKIFKSQSEKDEINKAKSEVEKTKKELDVIIKKIASPQEARKEAAKKTQNALNKVNIAMENLEEAKKQKASIKLAVSQIIFDLMDPKQNSKDSLTKHKKALQSPLLIKIRKPLNFLLESPHSKKLLTLNKTFKNGVSFASIVQTCFSSNKNLDAVKDKLLSAEELLNVSIADIDSQLYNLPITRMNRSGDDSTFINSVMQSYNYSDKIPSEIKDLFLLLLRLGATDKVNPTYEDLPQIEKFRITYVNEILNSLSSLFSDFSRTNEKLQREKIRDNLDKIKGGEYSIDATILEFALFDKDRYRKGELRFNTNIKSIARRKNNIDVLKALLMMPVVARQSANKGKFEIIYNTATAAAA